jgi:EmrB/QacA subfamily drug resistance transporter
MSAPPRSNAESERTARARLIALIVACAMFMAQLDAAVVMLALPQMAGDFGVQPVDLGIGIVVYVLVQAIFLPGTHWVADRYGARRVFALALAGFTIASILCAFSTSLTEFVAARALQGFAAAWMTPVGRIVLLQSTPKQELIGVMTLTTIPMLLAPTLGPPLGGFITTYLSWPWIFLLNLPFGIVGVWAVLRFIPKSERRERRPFDTFGFVTVALALSATLFGLDRISTADGDWQWPAAIALAGAIIGVVAVRHLLRHPHPVISLSAVRIPTYSIATVGGGALVRLPLRALPFVLPLLFQTVFGLSAFHTGLLILALSGGDLLLKPLATRTLRRFGFRTVMLSTAMLSVMTVAACAAFFPGIPLWGIVLVLLASGMFRSLLLAAIGSIAFADVPQEGIGSASNLWHVIIQVTNALAVSLSVILLNASAALSDRSGELALRDFQLTFGALALLGFLAALTFRKLPADAAAHVSGHRPVK